MGRMLRTLCIRVQQAIDNFSDGKCHFLHVFRIQMPAKKIRTRHAADTNADHREEWQHSDGIGSVECLIILARRRLNRYGKPFCLRFRLFSNERVNNTTNAVVFFFSYHGSYASEHSDSTCKVGRLFFTYTFCTYAIAHRSSAAGTTASHWMVFLVHSTLCQ